jgi:hypothetical protein
MNQPVPLPSDTRDEDDPTADRTGATPSKPATATSNTASPATSAAAVPRTSTGANSAALEGSAKLGAAVKESKWHRLWPLISADHSDIDLLWNQSTRDVSFFFFSS